MKKEFWYRDTRTNEFYGKKPPDAAKASLVVFYPTQKWWGLSELERKHILIENELRLISPYFHNPHGPAWLVFDENGVIKREAYFLNGAYHNPNGLAYIEYKNGHTIDPGSEYAIQGKFIGSYEKFSSIEECLNHLLLK